MGNDINNRGHLRLVAVRRGSFKARTDMTVDGASLQVHVGQLSVLQDCRIAVRLIWLQGRSIYCP